MSTKFVVETSMDGGETWDDCGQHDTVEEASGAKRDIDHACNGFGIDTRVVSKNTLVEG